MTHPILVGHDGTPAADAAVDVARQLTGDGEEVVVASVYGSLLVPGGRAAGVYDHVLRDESLAVLREARVRHGDEGVRYRLAFALSPVQGLHDLAAELDAACLVVGASHTGAVSRLVEGSVAEQAVHGAPCAVAVVPAPGEDPPAASDPVGAAYDGTPEGRHVVRHAAGLAARLGTPLHVLRVLDAAAAPYLAYGGPDLVAARRDDADADLARAVDGLEVEVHRELVDGDPTTEAVRLASRCRLLVTGSRGHGPLRRVLLGSVSTRIVRRSPRPVVVLPRTTTPTPATVEDPAELAASGAPSRAAGATPTTGRDGA